MVLGLIFAAFFILRIIFNGYLVIQTLVSQKAKSKKWFIWEENIQEKTLQMRF